MHHLPGNGSSQDAQRRSPSHLKRVLDRRWVGPLLLATATSLALVGCGGGNGAQAPKVMSLDQAMAKSAAINRSEVAQVAASAEGTESGSTSVAKSTTIGVAKAAGDFQVAVNRFYQTGRGVHFYTASATEAQSVRATRPDMLDEGVAFNVSGTAAAGLSPVHRFQTTTGVHFYTISDSEKAFIQANLPQFAYEGIAYHASTVGGDGLIPLYRFFKPSTGTHFYTRSAEEAQSIRTQLSSIYTYEGTAYYVAASSYVAPLSNVLPHTGITPAQCQEAGSDDLVACSSAGATALNSQQDGQRADINPMSFSQLGKPGGGLYSKTECVRDNVTGLIWEGKTASGRRAGSNLFTHLDDVNGMQIYYSLRATSGYRAPSQSEVDALTNSVSYLKHVNGIALCGFSDWRIPGASELHSIVDHSRFQLGPLLRTDWFPNQPANWADNSVYWSSTRFYPIRFIDGLVDTGVWTVNFGFSGLMVSTARDQPHALRLVRGAASPVNHVALREDPCPSVPSADRFMTAGAEAKDKVTGLTWARCSVGQTWDGSTCTGTATTYTHEQALIYAQSQAGWRLPNVKELERLVDRSCQGPAIDPSTFPATPSTGFWSTTPIVSHPRSWFVDFRYGNVPAPLIQNDLGDTQRANAKPIRLVRVSP
jgi:Protein of unknown function (DUF1566)/Repeat of unknown function (DUF5648)